jgi:hypothetical protein
MWNQYKENPEKANKATKEAFFRNQVRRINDMTK